MSKTLIIGLITLFAFNVKSQPIFTECSDEIGLNYIYPGNDFQMAGGGLMVIDVNNDGWEDLYQSGGVFDSKLWLNEKGTFRDATTDFKLDILNGYFIQGAVGADFDNDGFQDFFIANYGTGMGRGDKKSPLLLHNEKGTHFSPIYLDGILPPGDYSAACWGDFNKDGFSDLYIANYVETMSGVQDSNGVEIGYNPTCFENKLLMNVDGKTFIECASTFGLDDGGCGLAASFTDFDGDNDLDLLLLNDFGKWTSHGNKCYRNNYPQNSFSDISDDVHFNQEMYGMGIGQGDFDFDKDLDYFITNIGPNYLMSFNDSVFVNRASELGVDATFAFDSTYGTSWSGLFFDMEFDGDLDLYVSKGNVATLVPKTAISDFNKLYENINGKFSDVSSKSGVNDLLSHRGAVIFDFDHDGDLDIASSVVKLPWAAYSKREQKLKFYRNDQKTGNWIGVKLVGNLPFNADGFGAKLIFTSNGRSMLKEVDGGSGQASQSTRIVYFGLDKAKRLELLQVDFGDSRILEFQDLKANKVYKLTSDGSLTIIEY